jgi:hypothetical protein
MGEDDRKMEDEEKTVGDCDKCEGQVGDTCEELRVIQSK